PVLVERVGSTDGNQAIAALSALRRAGGAQLDLFVAVSNPSTVGATRRLEVYADGDLVDARELTISPGQRSEALISTVPGGARLVEARLAGSDALVTDDRAFAMVPADETTRALLVGGGNAYLENALALLPRLELYAVDEDGYADALAEAEEAGTPYGLLVFDGVVPEEAPQVPALYFDPDVDGAYGAIGEQIQNPIIDRTDPDEPLLRFVDLSTVHIGRAREVELADGMHAVVETSGGNPLVAFGEVEGRRIGFIGFDLGESDLPLQVAFPLLMSNLTEVLLPAVEGILPSSMRLGESVSVAVDPRIERVLVTNTGTPDLPGATDTGLEVSVVGGRVTIPGADLVGLREVRAVSEIPELSGTTLGQTAINLFSADESDVAPGDPQRIIEMGRVTSDDEPASQPTRAVWWWPLALAALALLAIEWLLFHRPTRRSLARAFRRRRPLPLGGRAR
ncbi:MAG: hypothetical protein ACRDG7_18515, partial [Candidatus Limnocylindria bacterium]